VLYSGPPKLRAGQQTPESVNATPPEVDRRGFGEIFSGAGYLGDRVTFPEHLGEELIIEKEIFR
jgi:hypothetical protein